MVDKRNVPEIRFKGFDGEWVEKRLGGISESYSGGTPTVGHSEYYGGKIPFIRSAEINSGCTELFITQEGLANSSAKMVSAGDILYALYGATSGEVGRSRLTGAINQAILAIKTKDNYDAEFITQWLRKQKGFIISTYLQGGQGNLSGAIVKDFSLLCSCFAEQAQIGTFFQNLDSLITLHQRKYYKLTTVKKAMLEKMFPKDGTDVPEIRFKEFTEKWERRTLGEIAEFAKGSGYSKNDLLEHGTPIILYGRLYTKYQVIIDDVDTFVIAKNGSVYSKGREVIVPASGETAKDIARASAVAKAGILLGGDLNVVYPNENINPVFLALSISNGEQCKELSKKAKGKSVVHIHNSDLKEVSILYPRVEEQSQIGSFFQNLDSLITLQQRELDKLKNIKKACLERMFV